MSLYHNKYRIESARLPHWNYRNAGAYFITICTKNRECFFGGCSEGRMRLNETGKIANDYLQEIPEHFTNIRLGAYVVMPNHVHVILIVVRALYCRDVACNVSTNNACNVSTDNANINPGKNKFMSDIPPKPGSISAVIRSYKSACTKWINQYYPEINFGWQSRFHDHIIRNDEEYLRIENYIVNNPKNWKDDKFYSGSQDT